MNETVFEIEIPRAATPEAIAGAACALLELPGVLPLVKAPLVKALRAVHELDGSDNGLAEPVAGVRLGEVRAAFLDEVGDNMAAWRATLGVAEQLTPAGVDKIYRIIERDARRILRDYARQAWFIGRAVAGRTGRLLPDEAKQLEKFYRQQQQHYVNLLLDMRHGTGTMDYERRLTLYSNALQAAYHAGRILADLSGDAYYRWEIDTLAEHCPDCVRLASGGRWRNGTFTARELAAMGVFPGSGNLACCTNCKCKLARVAKPAEAPKGPPWTRFEAVGPESPFEGNGRENREHLARRAQAHDWNHAGRRVRKRLVFTR